MTGSLCGSTVLILRKFVLIGFVANQGVLLLEINIYILKSMCVGINDRVCHHI